MLTFVLGGIALLTILYLWAIRLVANRIKWNFEIDELVDFDHELKGRYIDHITKMAILSMFSQDMLTIHGVSGDVKQAAARVFSGENFSFKRVRKIKNQR